MNTNAESNLITAITEIAQGALSAEQVNDLVANHPKWNEIKSGVSEDVVKKMIMDSIGAVIDSIPPKTITVNIGDVVTSFDGEVLHSKFETALKYLAAGCTPLFTGPAGSGKSRLAHQLTRALGQEIRITGPMNSEYKATGFTDVQGRFVPTQAYEAYKYGHVWLIEEIDGGTPAATVAINMILSEERFAFGNEIVERHPDFRAIATANTWGSGADRIYVGRNQLDGATMDRFFPIHIDYDNNIERAAAQNDSWVDFVQSARAAVDRLKLRVIISPRASIGGAKLLRAGVDKAQVAESTIWKGLDDTTRQKIKTEMRNGAD